MTNSDKQPAARRRQIPSPISNYQSWLVLFLLFVGLVAVYLQPQLSESWAFNRFQFAAQPWLALSHALVHLNLQHLILNLTALLCIYLLFGAAFESAWWLLALALSAVTSAYGLFYYSPQTDWCVGLSGALHGLFVYAALRSRASLLWIAAIIVKLTAEQNAWFADSSFLSATEQFIANPVVVDAHLWGAAGGLVYFGIARSVNFIILLVELNRDR